MWILSDNQFWGSPRLYVDFQLSGGVGAPHLTLLGEAGTVVFVNVGGYGARKHVPFSSKLVTFLWTSLSLGLVLNHEREAVTSRPDAPLPAGRSNTLNGFQSKEHRGLVPRTVVLALGETFSSPRACDSPPESRTRSTPSA